MAECIIIGKEVSVVILSKGAIMERLRNKIALIVDPSEENRKAFYPLLQPEMDIVEASSVEAAIDIFRAGHTVVDIVLTEIEFPVNSGFELLEFLQAGKYLEDIPVIVVAADNNDSYVERAFELGAIDYIHRPFAGRLLTRRVLTTVLMYHNKRELLKKLDMHTQNVETETDTLTGLNNKKTFYNTAADFLKENPEGSWVMVAIDIDHFRLFNQLYGRESGDRYLKYVAACLRNVSKKFGGVSGYAGADSFYYLCPDDQKLFDQMMNKTRTELRNRNLEIGFAPKFGAYRIDDLEKTVMDMCDCANAALAHLSRNYSHLMAWYAPSMEQRNDEFQLIREVEYGIRNFEFSFFLQPKTNMMTGKIVGAEALIRWMRRDGTIISPGVFVPVLERNGFISRVDTIVWEEVCRWQRYCIDMDYPLLPITINISRNDFFNIDVAAYIDDLVKQYELPKSCLELEVTESAYTNEGLNMTEEIEKLKERGFTILMDDFGSGYSSLNSLKEIDIDILKMDMAFLDMDFGNMGKGGNILESIVSMASAMRLPVIVEGVQTAEQVRFLTSIGCVYAQGSYYYAPMNKKAFEELLNDPDMLDLNGIQLSHIESVHMMELSEEKLFSDEMINNILGAIAFYEVKDGTIRLLRLNEHYYKMMGMADVMADPEYAIHLRRSIYPEDRDVFYQLFAKADENKLKGSTADIRYVHKNGELQWIRVRVFSMNRHHDAHMYYASLEDITDIYEKH